MLIPYALNEARKRDLIPGNHLFWQRSMQDMVPLLDQVSHGVGIRLGWSWASRSYFGVATRSAWFQILERATNADPV